MADYETIGYIRLKNQGGFVVRMDFRSGTDKGSLSRKSGSRKDITLGCSETKSPGDYKVEEGEICTVHADVVAGKDKVGTTYFIFKKNSKQRANFTISGTTLDDELGFTGIDTVD